MNEKLEFPFYLDSYKNGNAEDPVELTFTNYFPRSKMLQEKSTIIPINNEP